MTLVCLLQQYWAGNPDAYQFIGVAQLAAAFEASGISAEVTDQDDLEKGKRHKDTGNKPGSNSEHDVENGRKKSEGQAEQKSQSSRVEPLVHDTWGFLNFQCDP